MSEHTVTTEANINNSLLTLLNLNTQRILNECLNGLVEEYTEEFQEGDLKDMAKKHIRNHVCKTMIIELEKKIDK